MNSPVPLVTIIVPVRNGAATLRAALSSVADQTYQNLEIVLSDNASEDETASIMREFCRSRSDTTYVRHERPLPVLEHFSKMIAAARGKYILLCAADDRRNEVFVEALVDSLERDSTAVLAFGGVRVFSSDGPLREVKFPFDNAGYSRWRRVLKSARLQCFHFYGLWRSSALQGIKIRECTYWPDMQVMMAANCRGTFVANDRAEFYYFYTPEANEERARVQSYGRNEPHFRLHMIHTVMGGILDSGGGMALAAFGGVLLGAREFRQVLGEARLKYRSRWRSARRSP